MNGVIKGRRFTRLRGVPLAEARQAMRDRGGIGTNFTKHLEHLEATAARLLREGGLPDTPQVVRLAEDGWRPLTDELRDRLAADDNMVFEGRGIESFVVGLKGFDHDSREGFAARILECTHRLRQAERAGQVMFACQQAFELGELKQQARIHNYLEAEHSSGGQASAEPFRQSKQAARAEAARYIEQNPTHRKRQILDNVGPWLDRNGAYRPNDEVIWRDWLTAEPSVIPDDLRRPGRPRKEK